MKILPLSTKLGIPFTPDGAEGDPPPSYRYRPPTARDREAWRARVDSIAGGQPGRRQIRVLVEAGIAALCDDEADSAALIALRDAAEQAGLAVDEIALRLAPLLVQRATTADDGDQAAALDGEIAALRAEMAAAQLSPAQRAQLEQLDAMLRQHHPPYARAQERAQLWTNMAPRVAANMFLVGWANAMDADGAPLSFRRVMGEVPDELLDRLPAGHLLAIGVEIMGAMFPSGDDAKKPASPSGSAAAPTSSSTTEEPSSGPTATSGS